MKMLVVYDIAHPRRLSRVAKVVKDYGVRVQKSVFEVSVGRSRFDEMRRRVGGEIEESEDAVKYYPLCEKCAGTVEIIGLGFFVDPDEEYEVW